MGKALFTQVGQIKGKDTQDQITFTYQYTPPTDELKNSRGNFFALVTLYGDLGGKGAEIEKYIYQTLQSSYYSEKEGSNLSALQNSFEKVEKIIDDKFARSIPTLNYDVVAAVLWGEAFYFVKTESSGVIFSREGVIKKLMFNKAASGVAKEGDTVFLANKKFLDSVDIQGLVDHLNPEDFQTVLKNLKEVTSQKDGTEALVLRIYFEETNPQETLEMVEVGDRPRFDISSINTRIKNIFSKLINYLKEKGTPIYSQIKERTKNLSILVWNKLAQPWRPREPGHLEDPAKRRRARAAQIAVVLIILLSLSIGLALNNRSNSARQNSFNDKLVIVEAKIEEIKNLVGVNPKKSQELLSEVDNKLSELKGLNINSDKVLGLVNDLSSLRDQINKVFEVNLLEFHTFPDGVGVSQLISFGNDFVILDESASKILSLNKKSKIISEITSISSLSTLSQYEGNLFAVGVDGVQKVDMGSKIKTDLVRDTSAWGKIVSADTYLGNLYLLDAEKKEVWKYVSILSGVSSPQTYLKDSKGDIGDISAMTIDGTIWLGNKDGGIFKFVSGKRQKFEIDGLDKPFGEIVDLYTKVGSNTLFVLDKANGRVVLLGKEGRYFSQYSHNEFKEASSIFADEGNKTIFVGVKNSIKNFTYK